MKKLSKLKGFTLVELIVVMAIFSLIMAGAMAMLKPVTKQYEQTAKFESARASIDNIRLSVENNLRYADRVHIYTGYANLPPDIDTSTLGLTTPEYKVENVITGAIEDTYSKIYTPIDYFRTAYYLTDWTNRSHSAGEFVLEDRSRLTIDPGMQTRTTDKQGNAIAMDDRYYIYIMEIHNDAEDLDGDGIAETKGRVSIKRYDTNGNLVDTEDFIQPESYYEKYAFNVSFVTTNSDGTVSDYDDFSFSSNNAALCIQAIKRNSKGAKDISDGISQPEIISAINLVNTKKSGTINPEKINYEITRKIVDDPEMPATPLQPAIPAKTTDYTPSLQDTDETQTDTYKYQEANVSRYMEIRNPVTDQVTYTEQQYNADKTTTNEVYNSDTKNIYIVYTLPKNFSISDNN